METMNELILTIGLPYSGKSNWCKEHGAPIVCPDSIRWALHGSRFIPRAEDIVWSITMIMTRALFLAGHDCVILDACNTTAKRRDVWIDKDWNRRYLVLDVHSDVCIKRAQKANDEIIIPVIKRMACNLEYNGVFYGYGLDGEHMANHIKSPKGKDLQIYHTGSAND